jgi:hypothetical protein
LGVQPVDIVRPVFIIGCGRSGTTILGRLLSMHPDVVYLNEPRHIWALRPASDVWSAKAAGGGKLALTRDDATPAVAARIRRAFVVEMHLQGGHQLVEKLPANSFRIGYVAAIFPDARFIHLVRDGMEVAASIERQAGLGHWFGVDDYKWRQLVDYAATQGLAGLVPLCTSDFRRGLLEWRLAVDTIESMCGDLAPDSYIRLRYEELVARPLESCETLETWLPARHSAEMASFAAGSITDRSKGVGTRPYDTTAEAIAGVTLRALGYGRAVTESS